MPKLKRTYATKEEIDETFLPFYEEKDGKWQLSVEIEGLVPAARLDEMRETNIRERREHEAALKKFDDIDVEEYQTLKGRAKELDEHKLIKKGDVDAAVRARVEDELKPFRQKESEWKQTESKLKSRLARAIIESTAVAAAIPLGLKKGAAQDLIRRATEIFRLNDDGEVQAFEADGTAKHYLGDPYTIEQFVKDISTAEDGKHLFEDNSGGGGDPRKAGGGAIDGKINPWAPETFNRTLQGQILTKDRPLAIKMAAKHGVTISPLPAGAQ
jgi:hypothetical protein